MDKYEEFTSQFQQGGNQDKPPGDRDPAESRKRANESGARAKGPKDTAPNMQWGNPNKRPKKSAFGNTAPMSNMNSRLDDLDDDDDDSDDVDFSPDSDGDDDAFYENIDNLRSHAAKEGVPDEDSEFDDSELLERLGNLDDMDNSEHHSFHENNNGQDDGQRQRRPRREETNFPPGCDHGEAVDRGEGKTNLDKLLRFKGYDMAMTRKLYGEDIQRDPREIQLIQKVDRSIKKRLRGAMTTTKPGANADVEEDDDDASSVFGKPGNENFVVGRSRCRICQHAGLPNGEAARAATMNGYWKMIDYDLLKYGYAPDEAIFQEMADIFNREQQKVGKSGGEVFFITVEDVRDHMTWHNISNPMRVPGRQLIMCSEIIRECRDQLFGTTTLEDGSVRRIVHRDNLKTTLLFMKQILMVNREFALLRSQVNESLQFGRTAGASRGGPSGASRHLSSGPTNKALK